jgi:hypothetical protein
MLRTVFDNDIVEGGAGPLTTATLADGFTNPASALVCGSFLMIFDRAAGDWNRTDSAADDALSGDNILAASSMVFDRAAGDWNRSDSAADNGLVGDNVLATVPLSENDDGTFDRAVNSDADNMAATSQSRAVIGTRPGEWAVTDSDGGGGTPSATKAAGGAGVRHVITGVTGSMCGTAATGNIMCTVKDGSTVVWSRKLRLIANGQAGFEATGLNIIGTANTLVVVAFDDAPGSAVVSSVNATGYSVG